MWPDTVKAYAGDEYVVKIRDKEIRTALDLRIALRHQDPQGRSCRDSPTTAKSLRFLMKENVPGSFPFTAGVFAFKREDEDPTRMFAGEGDAFRTNRRFKKVSEGMPAKRLSTAFDSVTLYGCDPDERPGHLRQDRQLRRLDRHARRHEGALRRLRPAARRRPRCR